MRLKKVIGFGLSLVMMMYSLNLTFASEPSVNDEVGVVNDEVVSGEAVEADDEIVFDDVAMPEVVSAYSASSTDIAYAVEGGNIYFDESTGTITDADESITSAVIPSEIGGVAVTGIGNRAFQDCRSLTSITIPEGVTSIGWSAFYYCSSLTSITIPESVTSIGEGAFSDCSSLTNIVIPNSDAVIGEKAFARCRKLKNVILPNYLGEIKNHTFVGCSSLESINIPNEVISIGDYAFCGCTGLTEINIPLKTESIGKGAFAECSGLSKVDISANVIEISERVFAECSSLKEIYVDSENKYFSASNGMLFNKTSTELIQCAAGIVGNVKIPESVSEIKSYAFMGCTELRNIKLPDELRYIGDWVFKNCESITSIVIPNNVTTIGASAFGDCTNLKRVILPKSVKEIGEIAFYTGNFYETSFYCYKNSYADIFLDTEPKVYLDEMEFCNTNEGVLGFEKDIDWETGNEVLYVSFFEENIDMKKDFKIEIPSNYNGVNIDFICEYAFMSDNLITVTIPKTITYIDDRAFIKCRNLATVYTYKGSEADNASLYNTDTKIIYLDDSSDDVTSYEAIGGNFYFNKSTGAIVSADSGITSAVIPESIDGVSVTSIESNVFSKCTALESITIPDSVVSIGENTIANNAVIYCSIGSYAEAYAKENNITYKNTDSSVINGDITGDDVVNRSDLLRLNKYFSGMDVEISNADVNGDGVVNRSDLLRLNKYFASQDIMLD